MLRLAIARSNVCLEQGLRRGVSRQWQVQRLQHPITRAFADAKTPDKAVLPGSESSTVAGIPQQPILEPATPEVPIGNIPKAPPSPAEVQSTGALPPTGTGTASTAPPAIPPPPPKKRRSFGSFLLTLIVLSALGYGGGVYYSLVNDNFHDFFTEYVPFGEDAVAYFEEREFRRRFPTPGVGTDRNWPQSRGENKITIGRSSGVNARVAESENSGSDLGQKGRHLSAVDDTKSSSKAVETSKAKAKSDASKDTTLATKPAAPAKKSSSAPASSEASSSPSSSNSASKPPAQLIDHMNVKDATEPAVQELVKMLNNIITAVNASPEASKLSSTLQTAKGNIDKIIGEIQTLKDNAGSATESKLRDAHTEFDNAAKELLKRLEGEMRDQEARWREEFENERERLSQSYQHKLTTELDAAKKVAEQKNQNALLELEVALQKKFMDSVKSRVEAERDGRLSKLNELSASVEELEKLTGQWNTVVDATLQTQHLQVALAAVRAKLQNADFPTPFLNELVALKEVSQDNEVVSAAIATINPAAYQRGLPSAAALIDRFRRVAAEVRKASLLPEDAGVASHVASAVLSRLMFAKKSERGLPAGDDVEATLARTEVLLEEGDLDSAAREMNALKGWAGVLSRDWVGECRRVLEVQQAIDVISTEARLQSLLVD